MVKRFIKSRYAQKMEKSLYIITKNKSKNETFNKKYDYILSKYAD